VVVVCEFLPEGDLAGRLNEDTPVLDERFAVRIARVIDELRLISSPPRIDDGAAIQREQKHSPGGILIVVVACIRFLRRDELASVLDDSDALANALYGEGAQSMDRGATNSKEKF